MDLWYKIENWIIQKDYGLPPIENVIEYINNDLCFINKYRIEETTYRLTLRPDIKTPDNNYLDYLLKEDINNMLRYSLDKHRYYIKHLHISGRCIIITIRKKKFCCV